MPALTVVGKLVVMPAPVGSRSAPARVLIRVLLPDFTGPMQVIGRLKLERNPVRVVKVWRQRCR